MKTVNTETINTIRVTFEADQKAYDELHKKVLSEQSAVTSFFGILLDYNKDDQEGIVSTSLVNDIPEGFDASIKDLDDLLYGINKEHLEGFWISEVNGEVFRFDVSGGEVIGVGINWLAHYNVHQITDILAYATRMFPDQEDDYSDSVEG